LTQGAPGDMLTNSTVVCGRIRRRWRPDKRRLTKEKCRGRGDGPGWLARVRRAVGRDRDSDEATAMPLA
jgi:hypothetical protein